MCLYFTEKRTCPSISWVSQLTCSKRLLVTWQTFAFDFRSDQGLVFYDQELKEYSVPFMGSDVSVVKRSQRYLHTELQETPKEACSVDDLWKLLDLMWSRFFWVHGPVLYYLILCLMSLRIAASIIVTSASRRVLMLSDFWLAAWRRPLPTAAGGGGAGAPERPYELVVFGASGFTGQFVVEEVARAAGGGELRGALRWAVAGRRREKLQAVLERAAERLGKAALGAEVGVLLCDVGDAASLAAAARQTRLVLNCVGPSRFFGEPVVEACVENGASCIDVSGEPRFLEGMYLQYDGTAAEKGVYVIGSCGFDSIPADLGVLYTRDKLKGFLCTRWDLEVSCLRPCGSRQPEEASKKDRLCPCSSSWCKT
ncbi:uncharacterized protein WM294_001758 [Sarcoramphus papa]